MTEQQWAQVLAQLPEGAEVLRVYRAMEGDLRVITREAVADISHEESGEDMALQGGTSPLGMPYLQAGPHRLWRTRVPWLAALFLAGGLLLHRVDENRGKEEARRLSGR